MRENLLFVPIFKTKATAEPAAINACNKLFSSNIIPFVEVIESLEDKGYTKAQTTLASTRHFIQKYRKTDISLEDAIGFAKSAIPTTAIPTVHITSNDEICFKQSEIADFISGMHKQNRSCAIRVNSGLPYKQVLKISSLLNEQDYLIIDLADNEFSSAKQYIEIFYNNSNKYTTIIFSNERKRKISNRMLDGNQYTSLLNNSVIDAIKQKSFVGDGFGSYCSAKDDLNQQAPTTKAYAAFLVYKYQLNKFFVIKSNDCGPVSTVYSSLKPIITSNMEKYNVLFENTPISKKNLLDFLNSTKKGNASAYIGISIIHYIEEIYYNLIQ